MIQRIEARTSRLAIGGAGGIVPVGDVAARPTAGSIMHLPDGDVAADFKPTGIHGGRSPHATYELLVSNDTAAPLATFAYAADPRSADRLTWKAIIVPPFSAIAVEIDVALGRKRTRPRIVAELYADEAQLTIDAPPPQHDGPAIVRRGFAFGVAALIATVGAVAVAQSRPHVLALAAPATVRAGAPFSVAYALGSGTQGSYVVETPDGLQVRRGTLEGRTGSFVLALPDGSASQGYDVRVATTGRFGSDERTAHVVALPGTAARAARPAAASTATNEPKALVADLALERDSVRAGEPIVATYRAATTSGMVRLIDSFGTVRAEALLTSRGRSILVAPSVDADQDFRVVATVERGTAHAEATTAVTVRHVAVASDVAAATGAGATGDVAGVRVPRGAAPIAVNPIQRPARPIVVRVDRYRPGLHVALMGASTNELVGGDVAPGDVSIVLQPPPRLTEPHYAVVATYAAGLGQETLIRPITFRAP